MSESFEGRRPQTEAEAEEEWARSELLGQRVQARLDREGNEAFERIMEEEIDRIRRERGEPELTEEELAEREEWLEELDEALGQEDGTAEREDEAGEWNERDHPLVERVAELSLQMHRTAERERWLPADAPQEHPVAELIGSTMMAGPKLAGALQGEDWPPDLDFCAHTIVRLKRAREYLEDALRAAEACREENLTRPEMLEAWAKELAQHQDAVDALIAELRQRLADGSE